MERSEGIDPTIPVREENQISLARLQEFLNHKAPELGQIKHIRQFPGGYSNLTFLLQTDKSGFVLRLPPKGANIQTAHDMEREYKVLKVLDSLYNPLPTPILFCANPEIIGAPFFIMAQISGMILRGATPPKQPLDWSGIANAFIQNLADLHQLELEDSTVNQLGKPKGYIQRQVKGWTKRYHTAQTDELHGMSLLSEWLTNNVIEEDLTSLIHNDYKYDNLVLNPENPTKILAVLDWEMATVGHPLMDLGTSLAYWAEAGDSKMLHAFNLSWMPGNPDRAELVSRYFEALSVPERNVDFFYLFGLFKVGTIAQQIYARYKLGKTLDKRFEPLIHIVRTCGNQGILALEKGRINRLYS